MAGKCALIGAVCPRTADVEAPRYCPAWWEVVMENERGESKVQRGCGWGMLPQFSALTIKAAEGAAVSAQQARDEAALSSAHTRGLAITIFQQGHLAHGKAPALLPAHSDLAGECSSGPGDADSASAGEPGSEQP